MYTLSPALSLKYYLLLLPYFYLAETMGLRKLLWLRNLGGLPKVTGPVYLGRGMLGDRASNSAEATVAKPVCHAPGTRKAPARGADTPVCASSHLPGGRGTNKMLPHLLSPTSNPPRAQMGRDRDSKMEPCCSATIFPSPRHSLNPRRAEQHKLALLTASPRPLCSRPMTLHCTTPLGPGAAAEPGLGQDWSLALTAAPPAP